MKIFETRSQSGKISSHHLRSSIVTPLRQVSLNYDVTEPALCKFYYRINYNGFNCRTLFFADSNTPSQASCYMMSVIKETVAGLRLLHFVQ